MKRFLIAVALVLTGCAPVGNTPAMPQEQGTPAPLRHVYSEYLSYLYRTVDEDAGVVCYSRGVDSGVACFLLTQTDLTPEEYR